MIDLYSDTVTRPSAGMYAAMLQAPLGDDQRGDDPTARQLEQRAAELLGQPAALILPSATMANQIAVLAQSTPGGQVLCHETAHVLNFEAGGMAANAHVQAVPLRGPRGTFELGQLRVARPGDPHVPPTQLVVVENTSNWAGGAIWPDAAFESVVKACKTQQLKLHLDGARLFNAAVALGRPVSYWSSQVDSVQICFSKGLGCPFGAVLAGSQELIAKARPLRQRLGGALRQAGLLAGAMLYALDHQVQRLALDHARLDRIASALSALPALQLTPHETNILLFRHATLPATQLAATLKERGVWVSQIFDQLRICTHLGVDDAAVSQAIAVLREVCG